MATKILARDKINSSTVGIGAFASPLFLTPHRGVILYAMVCGRLPFGDDSQVKKMQSQNRQINFSRNLTFGKGCECFRKGALYRTLMAFHMHVYTWYNQLNFV